MPSRRFSRFLPFGISCSFMLMTAMSGARYWLPASDSHLFILNTSDARIGDDHKVSFEVRGIQLRVPINEFFLADRVCSVAICMGDDQRAVGNYIWGLRMAMERNEAQKLVIEVSQITPSSGSSAPADSSLPFVSYIGFLDLNRAALMHQEMMQEARSHEDLRNRTEPGFFAPPSVIFRVFDRLPLPDQLEEIVAQQSANSGPWIERILKSYPGECVVPNTEVLKNALTNSGADAALAPPVKPSSLSYLKPRVVNLLLSLAAGSLLALGFWIWRRNEKGPQDATMD